MTAIRKSRLQYIHFQCLTIKTTKIGYSNDRFGFIKKLSWLILKTQILKFENYPTDTQPNLKIIQNFLQKYFAVSKIRSTFAPAIERDAVVNMMERLRKDILSDVGEVGKSKRNSES